MSVFDSNPQPTRNRLLAVLPNEEYTKISPALELVFLASKQVLHEANAPIEYVYFPINCLVSLLTTMADSLVVEVVLVGNEGLVGLPVFLGVETTPLKAMVQIPGWAMRIKADVFKHSASWDTPLHYWLHRYIQALMIQVSQAVACNHHHSVEQQCCRWLLNVHDSAGSNKFLLTHEFLAQMLGVRRATVTEVALKLQKAGLLRYSRGQMTLLDRQGLEATCCECYKQVKTEFERLFG